MNEESNKIEGEITLDNLQYALLKKIEKINCSWYQQIYSELAAA